MTSSQIMSTPEIVFRVQGSSPEPYTVRIVKREGNNLSAYCDCRAGESGMVCKHRLHILTGGSDGVTTDNPSNWQTVAEWLKGSDIEAAIRDYENAVDKEAEAKALVAACKRILAKRLLD